MSNISRITNLTENELFLIIDGLAQVGSPQRIKRMFNFYFAPRTIDPNLVIEIAAAMADRVAERRARYPQDSYEGIPIASTRCQLIFLQDLYDSCMEDKEVGVNAVGEPLMKADYPTARKCVETANTIVEKEKNRKLREKEFERHTITLPAIDEEGIFQLPMIVHSEDDDEDTSD